MPAPAPDLAALVESSRVQQEVADRLGAVEGRVAGMERTMGEQTGILSDVRDVLTRMDRREEEDRQDRRARGKALWGLFAQPGTIILAAAAAYAATRFGVPMPIFPAADGASAPGVAAPVEPGTGGAF